jgi:hypothetical protein
VKPRPTDLRFISARTSWRSISSLASCHAEERASSTIHPAQADQDQVEHPHGYKPAILPAAWPPEQEYPLVSHPCLVFWYPIGQMPEQSDVIGSGCGEEFLNCWRRASPEAYRPTNQRDVGKFFAASDPRRWDEESVDAVEPPGITWHMRQH